MSGHIHRASFNAGVEAVLKLARATALQLSMMDRPPQTRRDFAINALLGLAEEGACLKIDDDGGLQKPEDEVVFESRERRS